MTNLKPKWALRSVKPEALFFTSYSTLPPRCGPPMAPAPSLADRWGLLVWMGPEPRNFEPYLGADTWTLFAILGLPFTQQLLATCSYSRLQQDSWSPGRGMAFVVANTEPQPPEVASLLSPVPVPSFDHDLVSGLKDSSRSARWPPQWKASPRRFQSWKIVSTFVSIIIMCLFLFSAF